LNCGVCAYEENFLELKEIEGEKNENKKN